MKRDFLLTYHMFVRILLLAVGSLWLILGCSINSFHSPETLGNGQATLGASWTAFPVNDSGLRIAGFPSVWLRYGLPFNAEAGMGVCLFRFTPQGSDQTLSAITANPYIKKQFIRASWFRLAGFADIGAGTGKFFLAGSDSSWDTTSQAYYGSLGAVFGRSDVYIPVKYTYALLPELLSAGFVSTGLGASIGLSGHRLFLELLIHYAGDDLVSVSGGGGFDF